MACSPRCAGCASPPPPSAPAPSSPLPANFQRPAGWSSCDAASGRVRTREIIDVTCRIRAPSRRRRPDRDRSAGAGGARARDHADNRRRPRATGRRRRGQGHLQDDRQPARRLDDDLVQGARHVAALPRRGERELQRLSRPSPRRLLRRRPSRDAHVHVPLLGAVLRRDADLGLLLASRQERHRQLRRRRRRAHDGRHADGHGRQDELHRQPHPEGPQRATVKSSEPRGAGLARLPAGGAESSSARTGAAARPRAASPPAPVAPTARVGQARAAEHHTP